jgi:Flp pilus assembly protein protease CpaA
MAYPVYHLGLATFLLLVAAGWDAWKRRIPNALNAILGLSGLWAQANGRGLVAVAHGLGAALLTIALLWIPWLKGRIGGGDVKMAGAAAVWMGISGLPVYLLTIALAGGLVAAVCYALSARSTRREIRENLAAAAVTSSLPAIPIKGGAGRVSVPYGVAVAIAAAVVLWRGAA